MAAAIVTEGLTKYYGPSPGIIELDLEVQTGEVFGFLGPNGSGKSTTIRTLLDLIHPTRGSARLLGLDSRSGSVEVRRRTGYLPSELALYPQMSARELIRYFAALRSFDRWDRVEALAERLAFDLDRRVGEFSTGNKQKLGIIQAFMHEPELLILDEPTNGLDPLMQHEFYSLIDEVRAAGRTVFLSSHVLPEVERLADRVGIVRQSRLVAVESVESLRAKALRRFEIEFRERVDAKEFGELPGVRKAEPTNDGRGVTLHVSGDVAAVIRTAAQYPVADIVVREADLEEIFLAHYERGEDSDGA